MAKTRTVYEVLWDHPTDPGPAADGTHIARFSSKREAEAFAKGKTGYGQLASVTTREKVPLHLAQRWGVA